MASVVVRCSRLKRLELRRFVITYLADLMCLRVKHLSFTE